MSLATPRASEKPRATLWFPRQHGAWAMIAVPLLLGVVAGGASPWQAVLTIAAVSGYLSVATLQSWARARFRGSYVPSLAVYGAIAAASAVALLVRNPELLVAGVVILPAAALTIDAGRRRKPRQLIESLLSSAQAVVLAPAAAWLGGVTNGRVLAAIGLLAAVYLVSSVLAVRSAIRERGNAGFAAASVGFDLAAAPVAWLVLGVPYALLALVLAARAAIVPVAQARLTHTSHPIKPIHLGLIEAAVSVAFVLLVLVAPIR